MTAVWRLRWTLLVRGLFSFEGLMAAVLFAVFVLPALIGQAVEPEKPDGLGVFLENFAPSVWAAWLLGLVAPIVALAVLDDSRLLCGLVPLDPTRVLRHDLLALWLSAAAATIVAAPLVWWAFGVPEGVWPHQLLNIAGAASCYALAMAFAALGRRRVALTWREALHAVPFGLTAVAVWIGTVFWQARHPTPWLWVPLLAAAAVLNHLCVRLGPGALGRGPEFKGRTPRHAGSAYKPHAAPKRGRAPFLTLLRSCVRPWTAGFLALGLWGSWGFASISVFFPFFGIGPVAGFGMFLFSMALDGWEPFLHTPAPRRRAFFVIFGLALSPWVAFASARLLVLVLDRWDFLPQDGMASLAWLEVAVALALALVMVLAVVRGALFASVAILLAPLGSLLAIDRAGGWRVPPELPGAAPWLVGFLSLASLWLARRVWQAFREITPR